MRLRRFENSPGEDHCGGDRSPPGVPLTMRRKPRWPRTSKRAVISRRINSLSLLNLVTVRLPAAGVNGTHVARRLRLARVSPRLIEALKKDEIDLDQLGALAFTDDHALQEKAFFDAPEWQRTPEQLKARVTQAHVAETDKLARFVGIDAYVEAGGAVASDLFADEDETQFLADRDLLVRLAEAKLEPIVTEVQAEGWAFVGISIDGVAWSQFPERVRERRRDLTTDETAEQERLYAKLDETEDEAEIEKIEAAIDALAPAQWEDDEVALAGAIVTLNHSGDIKVERGLVRVGRRR